MPNNRESMPDEVENVHWIAIFAARGVAVDWTDCPQMVVMHSDDLTIMLSETKVRFPPFQDLQIRSAFGPKLPFADLRQNTRFERKADSFRCRGRDIRIGARCLD